MNQYFNKKNIKSAVRVALVNPNTDIYINGERSKKRYKVVYDKLFLALYCGTKEKCGVATIFNYEKNDEGFINSCTSYFSRTIMCDKEA